MKEKKQQEKSPENEDHKPKPKQEHLSEKDWEEIMGMNRDIYTRRNGAVRRK